MHRFTCSEVDFVAAVLKDQWFTRVKSDEAGKAFKEDCIYEGRELSFS